MTTPINLNRFRKQKARAEKKAKADENAVAFGRTRARKDIEKARAEKAARLLEAHRREPGPRDE
ncbi:DUF4169 family protein [Oceanicella sp. SM1341]|uniref:DUF4169 family protein n=1 Tax=Oceanicella sp. SM1341 TaxID=1548889 RepID=UPI000E51CDAF|nr:DUF4169 family protein [Oceanicella sp. SM1341]